MANENKQVDIDQLLVQTYASESVPDGVNIRLKNQIACKASMQEKSISFWWLPATISTFLMIAFCGMTGWLYVILELKKDWFLMPNLTHLLSKGFVYVVCAMALGHILVSWLFTVIIMWKLNFRKKAHIF
ncbi:MAG: hypothetical protein Q4D51_08675 [Eubacteriales bacterium]|nr:hypothetical protein [Eubacteriales bacterium]